MRTVICHFFNEAYMLPWWLKHHLPLFDHGIMINHGSTDDSLDIIRDLAPHWQLVNSRLTCFDAYLTDFEVMSYEQNLPGWKIALNITEFLMPALPLEKIELEVKRKNRMGCAASGVIIVDHQPGIQPIKNISLPIQKHWGIDDNEERNRQTRISRGQTLIPYRNRFYHCEQVGMYIPGRHESFHPDSKFRVLELMIFNFGFAPWNDDFLKRKLQISAKLNPRDIQRGWGVQHNAKLADLQRAYELIRPHAIDLNTHQFASRAITYACT